MGFGSIFFSGSRFIAWTLVPVLIVFALLMPWTLDHGTPVRIALIVALVAAAVLLALALAFPARCKWAGRLVAAGVFVAYVVYACEQLLHGKGPFFGTHRGDPAPGNALLGLLLIGFPALVYAIRGRFRWNDPPIGLAPDDPLLLAAIARARQTTPLMLELHARHANVLVKFAFQSDAGETEHVWGEVARIEGEIVTARLINHPVTHQGPLPAAMTVPLMELEDWQVFEPGGDVRGGFSTRAIIDLCRRDRRPIPPELRRLRFVDS
jgi:uncharacterized protein YegJ (DUF2314 family)